MSVILSIIGLILSIAQKHNRQFSKHNWLKPSHKCDAQQIAQMVSNIAQETTELYLCRGHIKVLFYVLHQVAVLSCFEVFVVVSVIVFIWQT